MQRNSLGFRNLSLPWQAIARGCKPSLTGWWGDFLGLLLVALQGTFTWGLISFQPCNLGNSGTNGQGQKLVRPHDKVRQLGHSTAKNWQGLALGRLTLDLKTSHNFSFSILQVPSTIIPLMSEVHCMKHKL
jgi:hypothetical protein